MAKSDEVHVQARESRGSSRARRLRAEGLIPAVLYGHGEATMSLSVSADEVEAVLRHGGRVVELTGAVSSSALVREIQWDAFGNEILHMDLARVSSSETIETTVLIELRGDAPGAHEGGVIEHPLHEITIKCPVSKLPDKLQVNINHLGLGQHITVADLEVPEGVVVVADPTVLVVQCVEPSDLDEEAAMAESVEPEVIGRKDADDEEEKA